jgi:predicted methyltransferase
MQPLFTMQAKLALNRDAMFNQPGKTVKKALLCAALAVFSWVTAHADDAALRAAIAAPSRTPAFVSRDVWRHPYETLSFFGIRPDMTVVEISPGGGWYTEILAPYLQAKGQLVLAADDPESESPYARNSIARLQKKLAGQPVVFGRVAVGVFSVPKKLQYIAPQSADMVLTFRNVHNWAADGEDTVAAVFTSVFKSLKSGGVFGVVDHRLPSSRTQDLTASSGYLRVDYVQRIAQRVGFTFAGASEINANTLDSADHKNGVWALPPTFANKEVDREKYAAIGESDRMTLKFVKP